MLANEGRLNAQPFAGPVASRQCSFFSCLAVPAGAVAEVASKTPPPCAPRYDHKTPAQSITTSKADLASRAVTVRRITNKS